LKIVNSRNSTKKDYTRSLEETEMILDNIPGLVFYKDDKNNLIRVNKYFADAHKTTKEALAGKNCFDIYPKDVAQKYYDDDLEVIKSKKPKLNFIEPWDVAEGRRWVNSNKIPLYDNDKCIGIIGFSTDVTEQVKVEQKLKQAQEQFDTIFSNLKDTVFVISEDYKILFKNDTAHDIFGTELIGKDCYKVIKGQDQPCERCAMKTFAESDLCQVRFEQCVNTPFLEGERVFDIVSSPIESYAGQPAMLEVLRDITESKKIKEELKECRDHLEYMVVERTKELNCLYGFSKIIEEKDITKEEILKKTVELLPPAWQFPEVTCARIIIDSTEYKTENFKETKWKQASDIIVENEKIGFVEVYYLEQMPELDGGPFLKKERDLIDAINERLGKVLQRINAEQELAKSERLLSTTLRSIGDAVISTNSKGNVSFLNPVAESLTGWKQSEAIGNPIEDVFNIINEKTRKLVENPILRVLQEGVIVGLANHTMLISKDGKEIPIADSAAPIKDDKGNIIGVVLIFRDITERRKAENKLKEYSEQLQDMVDQRTKELREEKISLDNAQRIAHIGNWDWDIVKNELYWSDEIYRIFGLNPPEFGATYEAFVNTIHPDDRELVQIFVDEALHNNKPYSIDHRIILPNGSIRFVHEQAEVNFDEVGKALKMVGTVQDITDRKKAEEELKATLKDLKRSNTELEQFAYVASHDLQEPLRMVASFTQLLQNRYQDKLDEDANDFINYAVDGATRMQNLINDLLIFSRVGTRGKPFKNTDMNAVLEVVIAIFRQSIKETNVTLTYDPLPMILADESQMIELLQNLISNAIKFHKEEEPPVVHISAKLQKNQWIISVRDNGIGINSQFFDRIFIIFQRLHKKSEYEGTGIGLAICKKIIERHNGKIWVESELGKGSTFYFSVPKTKVRK